MNKLAAAVFASSAGAACACAPVGQTAPAFTAMDLARKPCGCTVKYR